jgi:hypothetical protein
MREPLKNAMVHFKYEGTSKKSYEGNKLPLVHEGNKLQNHWFMKRTSYKTIGSGREQAT